MSGNGLLKHMAGIDIHADTKNDGDTYDINEIAGFESESQRTLEVGEDIVVHGDSFR